MWTEQQLHTQHHIACTYGIPIFPSTHTLGFVDLFLVTSPALSLSLRFIVQSKQPVSQLSQSINFSNFPIVPRMDNQFFVSQMLSNFPGTNVWHCDFLRLTCFTKFRGRSFSSCCPNSQSFLKSDWSRVIQWNEFLIWFSSDKSVNWRRF